MWKLALLPSRDPKHWAKLDPYVLQPQPDSSLMLGDSISGSAALE